MTKFEKLYRFFLSIEKITNKLLQEIVREYEAYILKLNTEEQLYRQGINANSENIDDYSPYTPFTISLKKKKGQPFDRVTLRDTGDFHESFFLDIDSKSFFFDATDEKAKELAEKYGEDIFGLTEDSISILQKEILIPELRKRLAKEIEKAVG